MDRPGDVLPTASRLTNDQHGGVAPRCGIDLRANAHHRRARAEQPIMLPMRSQTGVQFGGNGRAAKRFIAVVRRHRLRGNRVRRIIGRQNRKHRGKLARVVGQRNELRLAPCEGAGFRCPRDGGVNALAGEYFRRRTQPGDALRGGLGDEAGMKRAGLADHVID